MDKKILVVSDKVSNQLFSAATREKLGKLDFILSTGDLPYQYLEYLVSTWNVPLYYVRGNHAAPYETEKGVIHDHPWGCQDLHLRSIKDHSGLLLAGIQGSHAYNYEPYQYSQAHMWRLAFQLVPALMANYALSGRYLDILVTHAPPKGIHDKEDVPHQGIKAFSWLIKTFKPRYHFHGHVYDFTGRDPMVSDYEKTTVINTYGYRLQEISI